MSIFAASCCWSISATPIAPISARPICKPYHPPSTGSDRRATPCSPCSSQSIRSTTRLEQIKLYVALFHPRLIGLTGSANEIKKAAQAYKVYYAKTERANKSDRSIDHSGFIFLVGRDGKYLGFFPPGTPAERLIDGIRPYLAIAQR